MPSLPMNRPHPRSSRTRFRSDGSVDRRVGRADATESLLEHRAAGRESTTAQTNSIWNCDATAPACIVTVQPVPSALGSEATSVRRGEAPISSPEGAPERTRILSGQVPVAVCSLFAGTLMVPFL